MPDILKQILADAAIMAALAAGLAFILKKWITQVIEHHYKSMVEREKAHYKSMVEREKVVLDFEKTKALGVLQTQSAVYPEFVELVYRLRNQFRSMMERINAKDTPYPPYPGAYPDDQRERERERESSLFGRGVKEDPALGASDSPLKFGEELYLLTEHLYKHRAFLDREIFEMLHQTKRSLQDANVLLNTITRAPERSEVLDERYGEILDAEGRWHKREEWQALFDERRFRFSDELQQHFETVDALYPQIVKAVQKFMRTVLTREQ